MRGLRAILALIGRAPLSEFQIYFGDMKSAFKNSLTAVGGSVLLIMIIARNVTILQRRTSGSGRDDNFELATSLPLFQIGITALFYLLAFTAVAFLLSLVFGNKDAVWRWTSVRHWMVFYALIPTALIVVLASNGLLPAMLASVVLFTVFIGWLFADIRLAYKVGEMDFVGSIFAACIVQAIGLTIILMATLQGLS